MLQVTGKQVADVDDLLSSIEKLGDIIEDRLTEDIMENECKTHDDCVETYDTAIGNSSV